MTDRRQGLTDADFDALKRKRDAAIGAAIDAFCDQHGWDRSKVGVHSHDLGAECYCACPDGPCQHDWTGPWREFEDGCGGTVTCSRCGMDSFSHDLRVLP